MIAPSSIMYPRRWAGLALLFTAQMLVIGITSYGFGLFVSPLSETFGLSRADTNVGLILLLIGMAIWSPFIGKAVDKLSPRLILTGGAFSFGAGAIIIGNSDTLIISAMAAFTLLAMGTAALGPLTASTLTARWFSPQSGKAIGIVSISASLGGFIVVPALAASMRIHDWRFVLTISGLIVALIIPCLSFLIIRNERKTSPMHRASSLAIVPTANLLKSPPFWCLVAIVGPMMAISQALLSSLIPYAVDLGISSANAAILISSIAISSVAGKLLLGILLEKIDLRILQFFVVIVLAALLIIFAMKPAYTILLIACMIGGISIGGTLPLWVAFISRIFGVPAMGKVMGFMTLVQMPLVLAALWFIGLSHDLTGDYNVAFLTFVAILTVTLTALAVLGSVSSDSFKRSSQKDHSTLSSQQN